MIEPSLTFHGIAASPGIAIGRAFVFKDETILVSKRQIPPERAGHETKRYLRAIEKTLRDLNAAEEKVLKTLGKQHARLIEAHRFILQDPMLTKDVPKIIESEQVNAEYALSEVLSKVNLAFETLSDDFFRERRHDLFDVGRRILRYLNPGRLAEDVKDEDIPASSVIIARNLLPSDTFRLKERKVLGFATEMGNKTSHVAILAQSLELAAVVGAAEVLRQVSTGDEVVVDGYEGAVYVRPTVAVIKHFTEKAAKLKKEQEDLLAITRGPAVTADGHGVTVSANLETIEELRLVKKYGGRGIGLFRTELALMEGSKSLLTDVSGQAEIYRHILEELAPEAVIIRLLDIGMDKLLEIGPEIGLSQTGLGVLGAVESSAAKKDVLLPMGLRGIRLLLRYPKLLKNQLRAILTASQAGNCRILLPMVSAIEEIREVRWLIEEIQQELKDQGVKFKENIPLGIMVEVPSVAIKAKVFLAEADFVSVGTNDLVQYSLACDRSNAELAYLYQEFHPSIIELLTNTTRAAHQMKRWVGICGELAANPLALPLLIGMGFDGLSLNPHEIPKIKKQLRSLRVAECRHLLEETLNLSSYEEVIELLKRHAPLPV
ncbi:MAG: phosphoenolpyruvate--protein phosphotransferase [Elusimicrobia bacterium]|nr:phosphoenolpyruvate--protein phosphotransferase [Elusimicrobiota bacterium]